MCVYLLRKKGRFEMLTILFKHLFSSVETISQTIYNIGIIYYIIYSYKITAKCGDREERAAGNKSYIETINSSISGTGTV